MTKNPEQVVGTALSQEEDVEGQEGKFLNTETGKWGKKYRKNGKLTEILSRLNRKKRLKHILIFAVFLILLIFFATGQRGTIQMVSFMKQKQDLENEIKVLEEEKKQLEIEKEKIKNDPEYIEKIAREKYKMKKKDEKVYQIVEDE